MSERRHPTVFPGFREMAERRHSVSGQLTSLRRELGLSQAEVAARMGTSQSAVARFAALPPTTARSDKSPAAKA